MAFRDRAKEKAYKQAWAVAHRDKTRAAQARWRSSNLDKSRERARKTAARIRALRGSTYWKRKNPERCREHELRWREQNKEKIYQQQKNFYAAHPGKSAARRAQYRARRFYATPAWLVDAQLREIEAIYTAAEHEGMEVDHIVPLGGKNVCGLHVPWNLTLATRSENARKGNRLPAEHECIATVSA